MSRDDRRATGGTAAGADAAPAAPAAPAGWPGGVRAAARSGAAASPSEDDGSAWAGLLEDLRRAGELVLGADAPATSLDRAEGFRHLAGLLRIGVAEMLVEWDAERPRFHWSDGTGKWGLDCADAVYAQAPVRAGAVYRIRGTRGSVHFMGLQLIARMRAVTDVDADELEVASDGRFEIVLGGEPRAGNWIELPEGASSLIVRQFFYDWDNEVPASFEIERIDAGERRVPEVAAPAAVARQLNALGRFVHDNTDWWQRVALAKRAQANVFPDDQGGLGAVASAAQKYQSFGIGYFRLADDEALLVEVKPPKAKYWSLHLGNYWMESLDYANFQTSLNGHQARIDEDGVFRAVVSGRDPEVPNWLDTAGRREGSMIYRWNQADSAPIPAARVVRLAELRSLLPAATPRVGAAERSEAIERRREHFRRRLARPL
jgi:hypothetical protein